jgi:hypothetical protein
LPECLRVDDGRRAREGPRNIGHDGVAVTASKDRSAHCGPVASPPALRCLVAAALTAATVGIALAQNNQPPAAAAPAAAAAAPAASQATSPGALPALPSQPPPPLGPPATEKRGFLNDFGQWWDKSIADFRAKIKDQQTKLDEFNKQSADAAKDAMVHMQLSHVIEIQETCPVAGNGAADCAMAATNACKGKGFNAGEPLDVRTAEKCAASLWVSGPAPTAADCPVETVLLRAACQ